MAQQDGQVHKVLGSEALGILLGRWRDGTFSGIADDWHWIAGYTKRYRWAVALYCALPVTYLAPSVGHTEEESAVASGVCSALTVVCLLVFCIMAVLIA